MHSISFANLEFKGLTKEVIFGECDCLKLITPINSEVVVLANENTRLRQVINSSFATFDGQWPFLFAKWFNQQIPIEKISGSDLIYQVCDYAKVHRKSLFLLGASPVSNGKSVSLLEANYGIRVTGYSPRQQPYPFSQEENEVILNRIEEFRPHFLVVAFGSPKQDFWLDDNKERLSNVGVKWAMCAGGTLDFVSGRIRRAPILIQKIGLEVIWRLLTEKSRLRRFLASLRFFLYVCR